MILTKQPITANNENKQIRPSIFVIHSTDDPEVPAGNIRNYFNTPQAKASSNYVTDWNGSIECIPYGYKSWSCGAAGNAISVSVELCETSDKVKFDQSLRHLRDLTQYVLSLNPSIKIVSHKWVSDNLGGTTHQDPIDYLAGHGISWEDLVSFITSKEVESMSDQVIDKWKQDILDEAGKRGILDPKQHNANEPAPKWFVTALLLRVMDRGGIK